jgi:uroporphyrinogen decarboxylase
MFPNIPIHNPHPDSTEFMDILMGRSNNQRVPLVEYLVDEVVMRPVMTGLLDRSWVDYGSDRASQKVYLDNFIDFWYRLGYDFVRFEQGLDLPTRKLPIADTAAGSSKTREWADEHQGMITSWEDFERYPWPKVEDFDFFPFEYINDHLPEGMGFISSHAGGIFEHLTWLMSIEALGITLHEDPALVKAIADRVGGLMVQFYEHLLDLDHLVAIFPGDDMGFRTGTLVAPSHLRQFTLPWQKRFAAMSHAHELPFFLHSCGNVSRIMEDLIEDVRIDGKHSYEDAIIPVEDFQARYGSRIAVLGGIDINILGGGTPQKVRQRTRFLIDTCGKRGRYAIGSGNSIPSYIPVENYLAMLDEAQKPKA